MISRRYSIHSRPLAVSTVLALSDKPEKLVIIHQADVCLLENCSAATASRRFAVLKAALGKLKHHQVSLSEYCNYYSIDFEKAFALLNR